MSTRHLWAFLAVALPVVASLAVPLSTVDLAYQLRTGGLILDGHGIPTSDAFTFTIAGLPWQDQQWLAQVGLTLVFRSAGWAGLVLLRAVLVGLMFALSFVALRGSGLPPRRAGVLTLVAFVLASPALALRPQLIGMALFAATLALLARRHRDGRRLLWLAPLLAVAWANVHGSFFLAPLAVGVYWLDDLVAHRPGAPRILVLALLTLLATFVTPFGPFVYSYALGLSTNASVTGQVSEWQRTSLLIPVGVGFYASAIAIAALLVQRRHDVRWPTLAWLAVLFAIGAYAVRGVAWWPIGASIAIAPLLATSEADRRGARGLRRANTALAIGIAVVGIVLLPIWRPTDPLAGPAGSLTDAPTELTRAATGIVRPGDRVFAPQRWGSWLELNVASATVFVDSRIELYPASVWDDYTTVVSGSAGWRGVLDRYAVTAVIVSGDEPALREELATDGGWRAAYTDGEGAIFVRA